MMGFSFEKMNIEGAYIINSFFSEDNRGSFVKNFEKDIYEEHGIHFECNEFFISHSTKNVIRGMHFQLYHPQAKLVSVISGKVFDVIVDLREESSTFGQWRGVYLSNENRTSLYIPRGCAHGFMSLSDDSIVSYNCDGKYDKETDTGILYCDPDIAVEWPIMDIKNAVLGSRDKKLMTFREFKSNCKFTY
ncbi:MAG: dTDP-4-dehydrorhamnose 3,5-epimerase [Oscillospiraceae bacterium]|nr:dTDP-4-dehydrorhamnose 3,5-epimerase [Oscillospiraceae bacterium]